MVNTVGTRKELPTQEAKVDRHREVRWQHVFMMGYGSFFWRSYE